jgi:hypothetical protein
MRHGNPGVALGTGPTGCAALHGILGHPDLDLVGLYVARPERAGRDAGIFVGLPDTGVISTNIVDEFSAIEADALSYFGAITAPVDDVLPFLRAGIDVVTATYSWLILPDFAPPEMIEPVEAACREGGASLFATGVEPGMFSDLLPTTLLNAVDELDSIRVSEIANYGAYPLESNMRMFGFGAQPGEHVPVFDVALAVWGAVVRNLAAQLDVELDDVILRTDTAITDVDVATVCYTVEAGTIAAIRIELVGIKDGNELITVEHINYVSSDACRHWPQALGGGHTAYRIDISGRPMLRCEVNLDLVPELDLDSGLVATAMRSINALPWIVNARPGVLRPMEVPVHPTRNVRRASS